MEGNSVSNVESKFSDLYKNSIRPSQSQEERRELFLKLQKEKRQGAYDEKRNLSEDNYKETSEESHHSYVNNSNIFKLMESEWLIDIPMDFAENWMVKFCPQGMRYLVVAEKGITTCYVRNSKRNHAIFRFKSNLPGGSNEGHQEHKFTILDCVYIETVNTFVIFDVLVWNSMSLINSEAQFRFYWLKSKFEDNPDLQSNNRKYKFIVMDTVPAEASLIQDCLFNPFIINDMEVLIEGLLFYHKEGFYTCGRSPLVGWLKCFMLNEKLGIDVPEQHTQNKPSDYCNFDQFIEQKKNKRRKNKNTQMEAEEIK